MKRALLSAAAVALAAVCEAQSPAPAAAPPSPPPPPKNLQVLPKDIKREELIAIMRSFAGALGVRCHHCHVGQEGADLSTFDFASDEKETKKVARAMIRMTNEINDKLMPQTGRSPLIQVRCVTCHGGVTKPEPLSDILVATAKAEGVEAAKKKYTELRGKYFGGSAYDFSRASFNQAAERLAEAGDLAGAIALTQFNLETFPGVATSHSLLGQLYLKQGDRAAALAQFEKAAVLDPKEPYFAKRVQELKSPAPSPSPGN